MKKKEHFISTAEEFWNLSCKNDKLKSPSDIMIEFAKFHVEAALKAASESRDNFYKGDPKHYNEFSKDAIINAYPLTNIK